MVDNDSKVRTEAEPIQKGLTHHLGLHGLVMIALVLLSVVGIGITDFSPQKSHLFWLAMVPVFGIACIIIEWTRARGQGLSGFAILKNEVLHWLAVLVAVDLVYFLFQAGRLDSENTGLIILVILALATFLAGLRLGWKLCLLGVFLATGVVVAAYVEEFLWVLLIIPLLLGAALGLAFKRKSG